MGLAWDIAYTAGGLVTSPVWAYRLWRTGKWRTDWPGRFGRCPDDQRPDEATTNRRPTLLIHAVSVGEVVAIAPLVKQLEQQKDDTWRLVISTTTDTGTARARSLFTPKHDVVRYPFDLTCCVNRFLDAVQPDLVALTELEVWPNFVDVCSQRDIPVCVINGRLSARSFKRYMAIRSLVRRPFATLAAAGVQTQEYADRFVEMGMDQDRVRVLDSIKWDAIENADTNSNEKVAGVNKLARALGITPDKPLVVAGSTGPGEERMLIDGQPDGVQLLIVPRKPERFEEVASLAPGIVRRSAHPDGTTAPIQSKGLFLLDTIGELRKAYALADVAIVGRSFLGMYGSNVLEPVALGTPTVIGPHYHDFQEIVDALQAEDGIEITANPWANVNRMLTDPTHARKVAQNGLSVILTRRGVVDRYVEFLVEMMPASLETAAS